MPVSCATVLTLPGCQQFRVLAGQEGLARPIRRISFWQPGDSPQKVRPGDLVFLIVPDGLKGNPGEELLRSLHQTGAAAVALRAGAARSVLPPPLARLADRLPLPVLALPSGAELGEVVHAIQAEILRRQYEIIERSELIHRTLTGAALEARDLHHITAVLSQTLHKSVTVEDPEYRLLAHAEWGESLDPIRIATLSEGRTPPEIIERCHAEGIIELLQRTAKPFLFRGFPDLGMRDRIVCPVRISGEMVAYVDILSGEEPLTDLDMRVAEHGATVVALHILRQQSVAQVEARVRYSFVDALLSGDLHTGSPGLMERARLFGFDPSLTYVVAIAVPRDEGGAVLQGREDYYRRERLGQCVRAALELSRIPVFMTYSLNRVVFFLPIREGEQSGLRKRVEGVYRRIRELHPGQSVGLACGSPYRGPDGIRRSYAEAISVTGFVPTEETVAWYEDLVLLRLLNSVPDSTLLEELYESTVGKVRNHPKGDVLLETLRVLVECDFRQVPAARALHVHRNTLLYRMGMLEEVLQAPLTDADLKLRLQLAFASERLLRQRQH